MSEDTKDIKTDDEQVRKRCFVMMPISDQGDYPKGHFDKVYNQIFKPAIERAGYMPYRVDENTISDSIVNKIFDAVQNCEMALCDLSNRNPNVLYELGLRQAYNKPVVLVCDDKTDKIFDVSGISTTFYNSDRLYENVLEAQDKIFDALKSTSEGKEATLVRLIRASEASFNDVTLDKDDTVNIMLQSIMKELQKLNKSDERPIKKKYTITKKVVFVENEKNLSLQDIEQLCMNMSSMLPIKVYNVSLGDDRKCRIILECDSYIQHKQVIDDYLEWAIGSVL